MGEPIVARVLNERRRAWLASARNQHKLVLLSVLLCTTSLAVGLQLDDYLHHALVARRDADLWLVEPRSPLDLFRFLDGDSTTFTNGAEAGVLPWYASPNVRLAFLRPLACVTHIIDYRFIRVPWLMHLHSLAWLFALGWAVARVVRQIEKGWLAGLIVFFYVVDAGHGFPAGWLAARNNIMAGVFGALALEAHIRWRRGELKHPALPLCWAVISLLAGESMIGWGALHFAFALTIDPGGLKRGLIALAPLSAIVVIWRAIYSLLGYGAGGSELYVDPLISPVKFLGNLVEHAPQLLAGQMGGIPAGSLATAGREAELVAITSGVIVVALFAFVIVPLVRQHATMRFWLLCALLATIPVCATEPQGRLMLAGGLGVQGLIARFVFDVVHDSRSARWRRGLAAFWLFVLGVIFPLGLATAAYLPVALGRPAVLSAQSVPEAAAGKTLVLVAVPDPVFMSAHTPLLLISMDRPRPKRIRCLAGVEGTAEVLREDARTLVIKNGDGLVSGYFARLLRSPDDPFPADWSMELSDVRFEIAERDERGQPLAVRARFNTPLDDDARVFAIWSVEETALVPFALPAIGESVTIRGQPIATLLTPE